MQKKLAFRSIIPTILLLSVIWAVFILFKGINEKKNYELISYVPTNAELVLTVSPNHLMKEAFVALVSEEDGSSFKQIMDILRQRKSEEKRNQIGMDLQSDMTLFSVPINNDSYWCLLAGLSDQNRFDKESAQLRSEGIGIATKNNVVLLIFPIHGNGLGQEDLSIQAARMLEKKANRSAAIEQKGIAKLHIPHSARNRYPFVLPGEIDLYAEGNVIRVEGEIKWDELNKNKGVKLLRPKGFHISIPYFTTDVKDSIREILKPFGMDQMQLSGLSLNYNGLLIEEVPGLKLLPDFDGLFHFENAIEIDSILLHLKRNNDLFNITSNGFTYGSKTYFVKKIDTKTVYIGRSSYNPKMTRNSSGELHLECQGDLSKLTQLEGSGMMRKLVELLSMYAATKNLLNKAEHFTFTAKRSPSSEGIIRGHIDLKTDESAVLSILNFLMDAKYIR